MQNAKASLIIHAIENTTLNIIMRVIIHVMYPNSETRIKFVRMQLRIPLACQTCHYKSIVRATNCVYGCLCVRMCVCVCGFVCCFGASTQLC